MSFEMVEAIKHIDRTILSPSEKSVLVWLAIRANQHTGECYPGPAEISQGTNHDHRTVRRALDKLKLLGLIVEVGQGTRGVRVWKVAPPTPGVGPVVNGSASDSTPGATPVHPGRSARTTPGATSLTPGATPSKQQEPKLTTSNPREIVGVRPGDLEGRQAPGEGQPKAEAITLPNAEAPETWEEAQTTAQGMDLAAIVPLGLLRGDHWPKWRRLIHGAYGWRNVIKAAGLTDAKRRYASEVEAVLQASRDRKATEVPRDDKACRLSPEGARASATKKQKASLDESAARAAEFARIRASGQAAPEGEPVVAGGVP